MTATAGVLDDLGTWLDGLLGGRLSSAQARVNAAIRTGSVQALIQPEVQRFTDVMGRWNGTLKRAEATAAAEPRAVDPAASAFLADQRGKLSVIWSQFRDYLTGPGIPTDPPVVGALPLVPICTVLVAGSIGVGVTAMGAAWAISAYEEAQVELKKTELASKELDARVAALKEGKTLGPFTLPGGLAPGADGGGGKGTMIAIGVGGAVGIAALLAAAWWAMGSGRRGG